MRSLHGIFLLPLLQMITIQLISLIPEAATPRRCLAFRSYKTCSDVTAAASAPALRRAPPRAAAAVSFSRITRKVSLLRKKSFLVSLFCTKFRIFQYMFHSHYSSRNLFTPKSSWKNNTYVQESGLMTKIQNIDN